MSTCYLSVNYNLWFGWIWDGFANEKNAYIYITYFELWKPLAHSLIHAVRDQQNEGTVTLARMVVKAIVSHDQGPLHSLCFHGSQAALEWWFTPRSVVQFSWGLLLKWIRSMTELRVALLWHWRSRIIIRRMNIIASTITNKETITMAILVVNDSCICFRCSMLSWGSWWREYNLKQHYTTYYFSVMFKWFSQKRAPEFVNTSPYIYVWKCCAFITKMACKT